MRHFRFSLTLILVLVFGSLAFAQTSNGTIAGTVVDPSGAAITTATVTATSTQTSDTRSTKTNSVGAYRLESLIPGKYIVKVEAPGFTRTEVKDVEVTASKITAVNTALKLGSSETVSVEANAEVLQTETGEISQTISETDVHELPLASLNPYALATTLPGVTTVTGISGFTNGQRYAVNGSRPRANNFLIEGQDNNDAGIHGQALQPENLDAIKEVVVLTNSYSAEFGHGGGSVANLIYKNGSNQFHGSGWELHQNSALEANDHSNVLANAAKTKYRENIFGFTVGGPVKKDKVFFFTSYQWDKYRASATGGTLTLPTVNGIALLQSLNPGNVNPRITAMLSAYGALRGSSDPTKPGYNLIDLGLARGKVEVGRYQRVGIGTSSESPEFDAKGDYLITKNDTLNLRYVRTSYSTPYDFGNFPSQLVGFDNQQSGTAHNGGFTYTRIFTPALVNELRASYGRIGFSFLPRADQLNRADGLGTAPTVSITGLTGWGGSQSVPQGRFHNTYQLQDSVTWNKGKHFLKAGMDIANIRVVDYIPYNFYGSIGYGSSTSGGSFTALANYIDDFSGKSTSIAKTFGSNIVRPQIWSQNYFVQDTWKIKTNLSADIGLRYELPGTPGNSLKYPTMDTSNIFPSCFGVTFTCAPILQTPDKADWGPRLGFAYTPHILRSIFGDDKTVIRGGVGIFYDGIFTNIVDNTQAASPNSIGGSITGSSAGRGTATWSTQIGTLGPKYSPKTTQTTMVQHLLSPETIQWNLSIQRELPGRFSAQLGYVGTRGEHLYGQDYLNPLNGAGAFTNPNRAGIIIRDNTGDSMYHGLQAELNRKFSKGLLFRASYTYSKMMDDVAEVFTSGNFSTYPMIQEYTSAYTKGVSRKSVDWGLSPYDHRQRLALSYVYDIPNFKKNDEMLMKAIGYITNDWQLSGTTAFQAGNPVNVQVGYDSNGDGITNDRPNLGNPNAPLTTFGWDGAWNGGLPSGQVCAGPQFYVGPCTPVAASTVHWIVPAPGTNGNVPRDSIVVPGSALWNFSILRRVKIHENHQIEFRTEMFNAFNHANTGTPNATLVTGIPFTGNTSFLQYPQTIAGGRTIRFWLKYSF